MAELLKGAPVSEAILEKQKIQVQMLKEKGVIPTLVILRVGEKPADLAYVRGAKKKCEAAGVEVREFVLEEHCKKEELTEAVKTVNADPSVHGCLFLRPLADKEAEEEAIRLLDPAKDVDGCTQGSMAGLYSGKIGVETAGISASFSGKTVARETKSCSSGKMPGFAPCTAQAVLEILDFYGIPVSGKKVVILGRSTVIGKPAALLLSGRDATVTLCHSKSRELPQICKTADILIAAVGKAGLVTKEYLSEGQILIDVGMNINKEGKLSGDIDPEGAELAAVYTPVPGGVGAVTSAVLAKHVCEAAWNSYLRQVRTEHTAE